MSHYDSSESFPAAPYAYVVIRTVILTLASFCGALTAIGGAFWFCEDRFHLIDWMHDLSHRGDAKPPAPAATEQPDDRTASGGTAIHQSGVMPLAIGRDFNLPLSVHIGRGDSLGNDAQIAAMRQELATILDQNEAAAQRSLQAESNRLQELEQRHHEESLRARRDAVAAAESSPRPARAESRKRINPTGSYYTPDPRGYYER